MRTRVLIAGALALLAGRSLAAAKACPAAVTKAALAAYPHGRVTACKAESEHGKPQYEVKIAVEQRTLELDISPEGQLLLTEERLAVGALPQVVAEAFAKKYPGVKASGAEKETTGEGGVSYELAFKDAQGRKHEATFREDGSFVEEG